MAIQLYRPGKSHNISGINCDIINCSLQSASMMINDGWFYHPADFDESADEAADEAAGNEPASSDEIRALAKEAGIKDYDKKRIKTLTQELEDLTNDG